MAIAPERRATERSTLVVVLGGLGALIARHVLRRARGKPAMASARRRYYDDTIVREALAFYEKRFRMNSEAFYESYREGLLPHGLARHQANFWAALVEESRAFAAERADLAGQAEEALALG